MIKVTEEALEQEIAGILSEELKCEYITQGGIRECQLDILLLINNLKLVLELKVGKGFAKFTEAVVQANKYKESLNADGIIVLMYPEAVRANVESPKDIRDLAINNNPQALILSSILNDSYPEINLIRLAQILKSQIQKASLTVSPNLVINTIRDCVRNISFLLRKKIGLLKPSVDNIVGSFDLFKILALGDDKPDNKKERELKIATCDLTSYILINQLLLYQLLSTPLNLPKLKEVDSFSELSIIFKRVTDVNYKAVYSVDVINNLPSRALGEINKAMIALRAIKPEYIPHDLLGRVFHEFLPFETQKLLGAFYTKPVAAEILAGITIDKADEVVLDPACGSGTLAVAAYRIKSSLDPTLSHKQIVANQIIGIDIMPFAAHLAALNLTLQNVLQTTDKTQIGIGNTLEIKPGNHISHLPRQIKLFGEPLKRVDTDLLRNESLGFDLPLIIDSVIMNPPFTRKERLNDDMKGIFINSFKRTQNYWAYFLAFSDDFLSLNGKIGAVLPRDFLEGQHSAEVRDWLFNNKNYNLKYVVKTVKDIAFSENARFRDFLIVLEKNNNHNDCGIIYLKKSLNNISLEDAKLISAKIKNAVEGKIYQDESIFINWVKQEEIKNNWKSLWEFVAISQPSNIRSLNKIKRSLNDKLKDSCIKLLDSGLEIIRGIEPFTKGLLNCIFIVNPIDTHRLVKSMLVLQSIKRRHIVASIKGTKTSIMIDKDFILPALKTASYVSSYDIGDNSDWIIKDYFKEFKKVQMFSGIKDIDFSKLKRQFYNRETFLLVSRRINLAAPGTKLLAFSVNNKLIPSKAFWAIKADRDDAKIYCLWLNSVIGIFQFFLRRVETEGTWCELTEESIKEIMIPSREFINDNRIRLLKIYNKYKDVKWPSLIEQLHNKNSKRKQMDMEILVLLKFERKEIGDILSELYSALADELLSLKEAMGSGKVEKENYQLDLDING